MDESRSLTDSLYLRKVNVIGLVFNAVSPSARDYGYYHYKEYFTNGQPNEEAVQEPARESKPARFKRGVPIRDDPTHHAHKAAASYHKRHD